MSNQSTARYYRYQLLNSSGDCLFATNNLKQGLSQHCERLKMYAYSTTDELFLTKDGSFLLYGEDVVLTAQAYSVLFDTSSTKRAKKLASLWLTTFYHMLRSTGL